MQTLRALGLRKCLGVSGQGNGSFLDTLDMKDRIVNQDRDGRKAGTAGNRPW